MDRSILYRPFEPDDGATLVRLHRRAVLLRSVRAYSPDLVRSWAFGLRAERFAEAVAKGEVIELALIGGAVAGFCGTLGEEITALYVDPAFMRAGVGSGLMHQALKRIRADGHDRARVLAALSGIAFYEAMGFHVLRGRMHPTRGGLRMRVLEMVRAFEEPLPLPPLRNEPVPLTEARALA